MPKKNLLFNDEEEGEDEDFKINEDYATGYERWRRNEELAKCKARGIDIDESSSSGSDEDEDGKTLEKPDNPEFDREFLLSLGTLYKMGKGENIDVKEVQFFKGDFRIEKEKEDQPLTLKDFERQVILEREGKYDEDETGIAKNDYQVKASEKIKLEDGLEESDDDDEGDGLLSSGLFKVKEVEKTDQSKSSETAPDDEIVDFVKGVSSSISDPKQRDILENVKNVWTNEKLNKKDKWLADFFLNKRYLEDDTGEGLANDLLDEEELSDDLEEEDNPLSTQYKFRHQEPGDYIKRHPRNVSDTLRPKDEKRKEKREATKQRILAKKEEKRKEIEVLKSLKLKEIEEKIDKIREASGNEDIDLGHVDLEDDFDPDQHDKYMEQMFGDDYYDPSNVEQEIPDFEDVEDDTKVFDNWTRGSASQDIEETFEDDGNYAKCNDDENFSIDAEYDCDYDNEGESQTPKKTTRRKGRRHQSKFSKAVEKEKPLFDPKEKDFASYFDEYYKLDFEDVVGGIPCRFKYRKVEPNNFGLTTEEILSAQNSDLNKWVGIKKIVKYYRTREEEMKDKVFYQNRALYEHVKRKYMPSLFAESPEELAEQEREKRRLKNLKRKQRKWMLRQGMTETPEDNTEFVEQTPDNNKRPLEEGHSGLPKKKPKKNYTDNGHSMLINDGSQSKSKNSKQKKGAIVEESSVLTDNTVHVSHKEEKESTPKKKKKDLMCNQKGFGNIEKEGNNVDNTYSGGNVDVLVEKTSKCSEVSAINENALPKLKKKKKKKKLSIGEQSDPCSTESSATEVVRKIGVEGKNIYHDALLKTKAKHSSHKKIRNRSIDTKINTQSSPHKHNPQKKSKNDRKNSLKKKFHTKKNKANEYFKGISDARLEAYGQNPKKLKNRVKYGEDV
ncbi:hypothetical protein SK128_022982 [Halocaridina rubra]|uniref:Protein KRI1 homolog n=1 Tax=Halocaridina rubra TaxID=373956 RepID=A0AAN9A987_HALRR